MHHSSVSDLKRNKTFHFWPLHQLKLDPQVPLGGESFWSTTAIHSVNKFFLCRKKIIIQQYVESHSWFSRNIPVLTIQHLKKLIKQNDIMIFAVLEWNKCLPRFYVKEFYGLKRRSNFSTTLCFWVGRVFQQRESCLEGFKSWRPSLSWRSTQTSLTTRLL